MKIILGFILIIGLCSCASTKSTVRNIPEDYCGMLSYQESRLSSSEKREFKKYGIIVPSSLKEKKEQETDYFYFKNKRIPIILISKEMIVDCETRILMAEYFDNLIAYGYYYEETEKLNPHDSDDSIPPPFDIKREFISKNKKLIAGLVYRFLSPKLYGYSRRINSASPGEMEGALLRDVGEKNEVSDLEKKLNSEGLSTQYRP